jgi:hypothetical protein
VSKFQQRHYEAIAEVVQRVMRRSDEVEVAGINALQDELANMFRYDNALFDRNRFARACVPGANVKARTR